MSLFTSHTREHRHDPRCAQQRGLNCIMAPSRLGTSRPRSARTSDHSHPCICLANNEKPRDNVGERHAVGNRHMPNVVQYVTIVVSRSSVKKLRTYVRHRLGHCTMRYVSKVWQHGLHVDGVNILRKALFARTYALNQRPAKYGGTSPGVRP